VTGVIPPVVNILYDGHVFRWQKGTGGVSRYFHAIISRLPRDWVPTLLGVDAGAGHLPAHPQLATSPLSAFRPRRLSQPLKRAYWKLRLLRSANLVHPTYYNLTGGLTFSDIKCPVVVTAHDFIAATYPKLEDGAEATIRSQREAFLAATHVVCVSRFTEQDLLDRYPQMAGKTTVIHHGSSFPICTESQPNAIFEKPTFLFIGNRATYKNFPLLLRAFAKACQFHPAIRLRVVGAPLSMEEKWQVYFLGVMDRVDSSVYPNESSLQDLYRQSVALLYPSRHEGFGIPPLEAMACGTIAVASNTTSLPEVVGDAGILLDPTDEDLWADWILQIARQQIARDDLLEKGRKRAGLLSWERSAKRHVELYRQLA